MTGWGTVIFVSWLLPGAWCDDFAKVEQPGSLISACLADEGCVRHLSQELSSNSSGNSSTGGAAAPLYKLKKRTTRVQELRHPGAKVEITGDVIISIALSVRGLRCYDDNTRDDETGALLLLECWDAPYLMNAMTMAWDSGIIFDRPAVESNVTVQFNWVDQCATNPGMGSAGPRCKMPYNMELLQDLYREVIFYTLWPVFFRGCFSEARAAPGELGGVLALVGDEGPHSFDEVPPL